MNLTVTTPSDREITMTREFDAPRRLVFKALTQPDLLRRWFHGPDGWTLIVCDVDIRVGGTYRYVWKCEDGTEMGVSGVCKEFSPPERWVVTESFDQSWYPGEAITTIQLREEGEKTHLSLHVLYESKEARDMVLKSGMATGVEAGYNRLAALLETADLDGAFPDA